MAEFVREFVREKATKNTIKLTEEPPKGEPIICGTLYLQKWAAGDAERVTVRLSVPD